MNVWVSAAFEHIYLLFLLITAVSDYPLLVGEMLESRLLSQKDFACYCSQARKNRVVQRQHRNPVARESAQEVIEGLI